MNKTCVITGDTRGIGKVFKDFFKSKGWKVIGFNSKTGLHNVIDASKGCDLFINNAYADGKQLEFLNQLYNSVGKMIVCGSVAAFYPDPKLPIYSYHKRELAHRVKELGKSNILMLHLSAKGYNDTDTLLKIIDLWLENSHITEITFDHNGEPNE
jgi:NADPH-dependent curcumin reductase CurA